MILSQTFRRPAALSIALVGLAACIGQGCSRTQTAQQALDQQYKDNPQLKRMSLAKFAGTVTMDGQPAPAGTMIVVMLTDSTKPAKRNDPTMHTIATPGGHFEFSTGLKGDGTKPGSYIVTFAALHPHGRRGFFPPDAMKNLYNDPDKNKANPDYQIKLEPPGKTDYTFDLKIAGETPPDKPGPNATTEIR